MWAGASDPNDSNVFYDVADTAIIVPSRDEVVIDDPDEFLDRLSRIQSAEERLSELLISIFNPSEPPTHESKYIRVMAGIGAIVGWIHGGLMKSQGLTQEYARKFNTATFEGRTHARKKFFDTYVYTVFGRGLKYGVSSGILCGCAGLISFGSITYRNRLYYPDWALGFISLGALTRFWSLGLRGAVAGGGFGLIGGTIGFGFARLYELVGGKSVSEIRYFNHQEYLKYRKAKREHIIREENRKIANIKSS